MSLKLAAICCTYKRPRALGNAIACFLRQDYHEHGSLELIVLDDAGQYDSYHEGAVTVVSISRRFRTLGEKRNASAALTSPDVDAYLVWDDDDAYLPGHASAVARCLEHCDLARPERVFIDNGGPKTYVKSAGGIFHGAWGFRRSAFDSVGGYPHIQSGQDQAFQRRLHAAGARMRMYPEATYVYSWGGATADGREWHLSAPKYRAPGGYERLAQLPAARVGRPRVELTKDWEKLCS